MANKNKSGKDEFNDIPKAADIHENAVTDESIDTAEKDAAELPVDIDSNEVVSDAYDKEFQAEEPTAEPEIIVTEPVIEDTPVDEIPELITEDKAVTQDKAVIDVEPKSEEQLIPVKTEKKDDKPKEPSKIGLLVKKYKLPLIIAAIVLLVALATVITIVIVNKNYVKIYSDIDFVEKSTDGKTTYVMKKDVTVTGDLTIPHGMNIDLNKYTLTVTGNVIYSADANDREIYIGDRKGPLVLSNGSLVAESINVNSPNATLTIYSPVTANGNYNLKALTLQEDYTSGSVGNLIITASDITFKGDVTVLGENGALSINAATTTITGKVSLNGANSIVTMTSDNLTVDGDITATTININDTGTTPNTATLNSTFNGTLNITNSTLILTKDSSFTVIVADNLTTLDVSGTINVSLTGGLLVIYRAGSSCPLTVDSVTIDIYEDTNIVEIIDAGNVFFYTRLESPMDVVVSQEGASLFCYVAVVNNAENYILTIGGVELPPSATNVIDITTYITEPGDHTITAKAVSSNPQLLDSAPKSITYTYQIKLATPMISLDDLDGYVIVFDSIPFATSYKYSINNNDYTYIDFVPGDLVSINIAEKVAGAGVYVIKVKAYGTSEEAFKPSETATVSFINKITLAAVTKDEANIEVVRTGTNLLLDWDAVANAGYYSVYVDDVMVVKTKNTSYSWTLGDLADNSSVKVIVDGYGYYNASAAATTTYEYETLDAPDLGAGPYVTGVNVTLNWSAVANATEYTIYLDGVQVGDPITTTSYTVAHTTLSSGVYTVKASADYFRPATSVGVTVPLPQLAAPIIAYDIVGSDVVINWVDVTNATSYKLYKVGTPDVEIDTTTSSPFTFSYAEGASYYIVASAVGYQSSTSNTVAVPAP